MKIRTLISTAFEVHASVDDLRDLLLQDAIKITDKADGASASAKLVAKGALAMTEGVLQYLDSLQFENEPRIQELKEQRAQEEG